MPRHFANWLEAYQRHTASSEAPAHLHFWVGVSTLAGALRRRVWRDELIFQWTPNFYIILVGPAGVVTKSTTIGLGTRLLRQVEGVHFGPESMTWQALGLSFADAAEYVAYIEAGEEKKIAQAAVTCSISELGTFLRPDNAELMSFLTRMWDGQKDVFHHRTVASTQIKVENPWLNIIAATTPEWLRNNFPKNLIGEGLTSRVVFVYADQKRHLLAYPSRGVPGHDFYRMENQLVEDLQHIASLAGPYELDNKAEAWGQQWYEEHNNGRASHMVSDRYSGYIARKQTHLHKMAIVLAASKRDELVLLEEDLIEAEQALLEAEKSMIKVFESIGVVDEAKTVAEVVHFIRVLKRIPIQELWQNYCQNTMAKKDFENAIRVAFYSKAITIDGADVIAVQPTVH